MTSLRKHSGAVADAIARRLESPAATRRYVPQGRWFPQSLAVGAAGIALLHVERARADLAPWGIANDWLACASGEGTDAGDASHLHYGAPALAFVLHAAAAGDPRRYASALGTVDRAVAHIVRARLDRAHARMDARHLPALAEFDAIRGLAGLGVYLLRVDPAAPLLREVLDYLVRLTEPVTEGGEHLPGWWAPTGPSGRPSPDHPGGHANNGVAHGISGPLALLALAHLRGTTVAGQAQAMARICAWLDRWHQPGHGWPYWVTRPQLRSGHVERTGPQRPSWCYGTAGLARAQQLAGLATGDTFRQDVAEASFAAALTDPAQLAATTDASLCHGYAGLAHVARLVADALTPGIGDQVPNLLEAVARTDDPADKLADDLLHGPGGVGLLEGAAGIALALHTAAHGASASGWDGFLLVA